MVASGAPVSGSEASLLEMCKYVIMGVPHAREGKLNTNGIVYSPDGSI